LVSRAALRNVAAAANAAVIFRLLTSPVLSIISSSLHLATRPTHRAAR
jgi:hypothetical protein